MCTMPTLASWFRITIKVSKLKSVNILNFFWTTVTEMDGLKDGFKKERKTQRKETERKKQRNHYRQRVKRKRRQRPWPIFDARARTWYQAGSGAKSWEQGCPHKGTSSPHTTPTYNWRSGWECDQATLLKWGRMKGPGFSLVNSARC